MVTRALGLSVCGQALGCLLYYLAYGKLPFLGEAKLQILNGVYSLPETRAPALRQLIRLLLVTRPADRPDIQSVLQHVQSIQAATGLAVRASVGEVLPQSGGLAPVPASLLPAAGVAVEGKSPRQPARSLAQPGPDTLAPTGTPQTTSGF